ncbi:MAG: FecR domain-containing protein [Polyangiaceae bacterium]|nr:FecR domain-containing protein [Polyangiaceae bacterium]
MTDRSSTPDVLRDWARAPIPLDDGGGADERRARVVSQMARTIRESHVARQQAERRGRALWMIAAAAVVALAIGGLWRGFGNRSAGVGASVRPASAGVLVARGAESRAARSGADEPLEAGDVLSTVAEAQATLRLASGAQVGVEPSSRVTLTAVGAGAEQIDLGVGEVSVRVPALGERGSFRVHTPDARVVVHGTAFVVRVTSREGGGTDTSVTVSEGKVSVEHGGATLFLTAGQSWSSKPREQAAHPAPVISAEPAPPAAPNPGPRKAADLAPAPSAPVATAATDRSALAEQNRLFAAAATARKSGDDRAALGHLNQLLARFPQSPLAPEARVERFRTLKRLGQHAEAAREARRYLLDHQGGAARDEARGVALEPSGK